MAIALSVTCPGLDEQDLQALVQDLSRDLSNESGVEASIAESTAPPGSRGELITLGIIVLAFIKSGAAKAAFDVLKAYVEREPKLTFSMDTPQGKVTFDASNLSGKRYQELVALAQSASGASRPKEPA